MGLSKNITLIIKDYNITLDEEIKFYEFDTIDLCFSILDFGIVVEDGIIINKLMPINALDAYMLIETPDGTDNAEPAEIEDNKIIFRLGNRYSRFVGIGRMQIVIVDKDGCRIALPEFNYEIRKNIDRELDWDNLLTLLATEKKDLILDEYGNPLELVKISELEETTVLPTDSYTMIIDGETNKKIKTDLIVSVATHTHNADEIIQNENHRFVTDDEKEVWNNKSDFDGDYNNLINIPNLATEEYVAEKIQEAQDNNTIDLSDYAKIENVPTKVSQLENDMSYLTSVPIEYVTETELNNKGYLTQHQDLSNYAKKSELFSKNYNDLINIPTDLATEGFVEEKIQEAQLEGGNEESIDLSDYAKVKDIPTKVSQLTNDVNYLTSIPSEYITETELNNKGYLTQHQSLDGYAKTTDIPTKVSQLTNDSNYLTSIPSEYVTETELNSKGYLTQHQSLDGYAKASDVPTKTSQLTNDSNYLTSVPSEYVTETELNSKGYLTQHQDLSNYATKSELFSKNYNDLTNIPTDLATEGYVAEKIQEAQLQGGGDKPNLDEYAKISDVPTVMSQLNNDCGYVTSDDMSNYYINEIVNQVIETLNVWEGGDY